VGSETVWIEMEHGPADYALVETLCVSIEAGGGIPAVRVPDGQRHHVLRALEVGARIVIVPMVNTPEQARQVVEFGKFPPLGSRGYNVRSRGVEYGLGGRPPALFTRADERTHLFAQIETLEAVAHLGEICRVEGLSGIFIGPGDLSASLGVVGKLDSDAMIRVVQDAISTARSAGKHAGILVTPGRLLDAALEAGADLVYYGGDVTELSLAWQNLLERVPLAASAGQAQPQAPAEPQAASEPQAVGEPQAADQQKAAAHGDAQGPAASAAFSPIATGSTLSKAV
jgi:2-keto-3-deoxy-L-rhamnonate aldolase RhmA